MPLEYTTGDNVKDLLEWNARLHWKFLDTFQFIPASLHANGWQSKQGYLVYEMKNGTFVDAISEPELQIVHSFFNEDLKGEHWNLDKVYAVINEPLQQSFENEIVKIKTRFKENPSLFLKQDWKQESNSSRQFVYDRLEGYLSNFPWNQNTEPKIALFLHGTDEAAVWSICQSGFATLATRDNGYYGKGIYFTHYAEKAAKYTESGQKIFIISSVVPGNAFPAVESPFSEKSLMGHPLIPGYTSHYALVDKDGLPFSGGTLFDELVVFQESQILPRYVIYATRSDKDGEEEPKSDLTSSLNVSSDFPQPGELYPSSDSIHSQSTLEEIVHKQQKQIDQLVEHMTLLQKRMKQMEQQMEVLTYKNQDT